MDDLQALGRQSHNDMGIGADARMHCERVVEIITAYQRYKSDLKQRDPGPRKHVMSIRKWCRKSSSEVIASLGELMIAGKRQAVSIYASGASSIFNVQA